MSEVQQEQTLKRGLKTDTYSLSHWVVLLWVQGCFWEQPQRFRWRGLLSCSVMQSPGFIAFLIMRQQRDGGGRAGYGSFSHLPINTGVVLPFLSGWNYWAMFVLVGMAELTAVGEYIKFWWDVPTWVSAAIFSC